MRVELGWVGLGWVGLGWIGLDWFGLVWFGLGWIGLVWLGFVWGGLGWFGLVWLAAAAWVTSGARAGGSDELPGMERPATSGPSSASSSWLLRRGGSTRRGKE